MSSKSALYNCTEQQMQLKLDDQSARIELAWRVCPKKFTTSDKQREWDYQLMKEIVSIVSFH